MVSNAVADDKIGILVVSLVCVVVMNRISRLELSSDRFFSNKPVFLEPASIRKRVIESDKNPHVPVAAISLADNSFFHLYNPKEWARFFHSAIVNADRKIRWFSARSLSYQYARYFPSGFSCTATGIRSS